MAHTFEDLVKLEQAAVTEYAAESGESRVGVEMAVKKAVRHPVDA